MTVEPEFKNKFLPEHGYKPYKCKVCGATFWSRVPRETCPDRPCSKYDFLIKDYPNIKSLSLEEVRRRFIDYFVRNNHGYIEPYPVLARWRNDLYLTIASIVVFQPAVTEGIVDPPHNPLVIVQPCIRLEDIDNVGLTFGRHLTSFEMGGHHAFNKKDNHIYWVDETLGHAFEFFTKEIGIDPDDLVFKESWWEGGGNAGPAYEVVVDGLELATLVFMKYRIRDDKRELMPITVVDTGYGIERIAWFTQRLPTSYHTIYGELVDKYKDLLGIEEPPYDVLRRIAYLLSDKEIDSLDKLKHEVERIGYTKYYEQLIESIRLYTLLDHIRTVSLMLSDYIVPSNVGEGYLARLVIRRALKTLLQLNIEPSRLEDVILELFKLQANYWKDKYIYSKFRERMDYIVDVLSVETKRFLDVIDRGFRIVKRILKKKKKLDLDAMIEIYDSHGIPPEIVVSYASRLGVKIDVPPNFYSIVASRHGGSRALIKEKKTDVPSDIASWASSFPETSLLFHKDPYMREFKARILGIRDNYVILDQTAFYPRGGGQEHDTGVIEIVDNKYRVEGVYKVGNVIIHRLDKEPSPENIGTEIRGVIDWDRRYTLMKHHTATHIILSAARRVLGEHVWQAGAEKTTEKARLDITHYKQITEEEIRMIEEIANKVIQEHIGLKIHYLPKFEAEKKYGLKIYEGGAVIQPIIRIVEIPGYDAEACFGTHVANTSEVGAIKIINTEKIQDGVYRLEYIASTRLPPYIEKLENEIKEIADVLGLDTGSPVNSARKKARELYEQRMLISEYRKLVKELLMKDIENSKIPVCNTYVAVIKQGIGDKQLFRELVEYYSLKKKYIAISYDEKLVEIATHPETCRNNKINLTKVVEELKKYGARGGGKKDHVTIRIEQPEKHIDKIIELIANQCKPTP